MGLIKIYRFEPSKPQTPRRLNFVALDTETESDGSFICGGYYGELLLNRRDIYPIEEYCDNEQEFREKFLTIESYARTRKAPFSLVGFNTAYDIVYLGDIVNSNQRRDAGSRFIQAKTVNGTKIFDVSNHVIGRLEDWINKLEMDKQGIIKREGYLDSIEGKKSQVLDDARATWILAKWIQDRYITTWNIPFTPTKFGAALKVFQKNYFHPKNGGWFRKDDEQWKSDLERQSYFGGRCEVFRRGEYEAVSHDVNSMYVSIMRDNLIPNPTECKYLKDPIQIEGMINSEFMTVECDVYVPKTRIGLLPYRANKLIFPWGWWHGVYNSVELREALKWGLEITSIKRALWYPESEYYFSDYAQMTLDGRKTSRENNNHADEQLYKYMGNGLYGKFGQMNSKGGEYIRIGQWEGDWEGIMIIPGMDDFWIQLPREEFKDAKHAFPIIPATVVAYARAQMLRALCNNPETVIYCDTDSIKTIGQPIGIDIGDEPGQWGYEYTEVQDFYRPKRYGNKRKGIPKKHTLVYKDHETEIYEFEKPTKFRSSLRRGIKQNVWEKVTKQLSLLDDKREWLEDGSSYPLFIDDRNKDNIDIESGKNIMPDILRCGNTW